jgi:cytochrome P450
MATDARSDAPARAGLLDVLRLGAKLGANVFRGAKADPGATVCRWARDAEAPRSAVDVDIAIPMLPLELVGSRTHSEQILGGRPGVDGLRAGKLKTDAMSFLAPGALIIANGDAWQRLRQFNERVLGTGGVHPFAQTFLGHVRAAFAEPVRSRDDVAAAMGRAMVKIVVGDLPPNARDPAKDVTTLFGVVQNPVKRKLLGFLYRGRRRRLYAVIGRKHDWSAEAGGREQEQTLIALTGQGAVSVDRETLLQQIPHWMFTFTGSGADLLTRTLCMVTSRDDALAKVLAEIRIAGAPDRAESIAHLPYLEACIRETGRLFPPVTRTFHRPADDAGGKAETVHYFPLLQRDDSLGPTVHDFRPERWLTSELDAPAAASNLFLRGPRACPGMDLILFVIKAAAAKQLGELGLSARQDRLTRDPLPVSFPKLETRFTVSRRAQ